MRTRFAPSPTGELHLGGLRTALYSYCLARKQPSGKFFLRIEDTDASRTVAGAADRIVSVLDRIGLDRDGPLVQQSKRLDEYRKVASKLLSENKAYRCYCSKERLESLRSMQQSQSQQTKYDGKCSHLSVQESEARAASGEPSTIRMKNKLMGETIVKDEIAGTVRFSNAVALDDQILIKQDGWPTYHLAAVVDDHEMNITHVVRGDEWLPSTPKHLTLYEMLGWKPPKFAHLPLLLTPDGKKLSKRSPMGASVESLLNRGYLPSALLNFVFLLGWGAHSASGSSTSNIVFYDKKELVEKFSLESVNRSAAIVDEDRLTWLNSMHIRQAIIQNSADDPNISLIKSAVESKCSSMPNFSPQRMDKVLDLLKERVHFPLDFVGLGGHFFETKCGGISIVPKEVGDGDAKATSLKVFDETIKLAQQSIPSKDDVENMHKNLGLRKKSVMTPLRWAVTGQLVGAPVPESMQILTPIELIQRLEAAREAVTKV